MLPAPSPRPSTAAVPAPAPGLLSPAAAARLAHLFRLSTRAGCVHPLQPLLQRYRAREAA